MRPGAVRHDIAAIASDGSNVPDGDTDVRGVMCSAFRNTDGKWVVVAINYSEENKPFRFKIDDGSANKWTAYRTSDISAESLMPTGSNNGSTILPPRSVTTFVSE